MRTPSECPVCGEDLPPKARSCPHCGADERTGWNEETTRYDGADLPESAFEDVPAPARRPRQKGTGGLHPFWWMVALALALLFIWGLLGPLL